VSGKEALRRLALEDGLRSMRLGSVPVWLHEDHRWVLPLIWLAQEAGRLPRPTPVILLDRHSDAAVPEAKVGVAGSLSDVWQACERALSRHDDDWIVAGMRLGLIGDVWIYGVDDRLGELPHREGEHVIRGRWELMGGMARERIELPKIEGPYLLDIDLDCFAYPYRGAVWPWPEAVWEWEFGQEGGGSLWRELRDKAGVITVCREAGCCGGEDHCERIWAAAAVWLFQAELCLVD
jgi:hypothetical protein